MLKYQRSQNHVIDVSGTCATCSMFPVTAVVVVVLQHKLLLSSAPNIQQLLQCNNYSLQPYLGKIVWTVLDSSRATYSTIVHLIEQ